MKNFIRHYSCRKRFMRAFYDNFRQLRLLGRVMAKTPTMLRCPSVDDITSLDPAESFEFAGSDVNRNVYKMLINFDPMNLDGYKPEVAESWEISADGKSSTLPYVRDCVSIRVIPLPPKMWNFLFNG